MLTVRDVLDKPIIYDIVVSDFGRDATIEYLRLVSLYETRVLKRILRREHRTFFDEYRRIMYSAVGDLAFFKETAIAESASRIGYFTEDILIGVGTLSPRDEDFIARIGVAVVHEALAAVNRGHRRLRVAIPCNTMSGLMQHIGALMSSADGLNELATQYAFPRADLARLSSADITVHTVPEAVVRHLATTGVPGEPMRMLVLGTRNTNAMYRELAASLPIEIVALSDSDYELIHKTVVASIGDNQRGLEQLCLDLAEFVIHPRRGAYGVLVVIEACTDFRLQLGLSSLDIFAAAMVTDCYGPLSSLDMLEDEA